MTFVPGTCLRPELPIRLRLPVEALSKLLLCAKQSYYAGEPFLSDQEFDAAEAMLAKLDPDHPTLLLVGDPAFGGGDG